MVQFSAPGRRLASVPAAPPGRTFLSRGELATRTGCDAETIRYYERVGLLTPPPRSAGGHRRYAESDAQRLLFVRRARELGFAIEEIRALLGLADERSRSCARVHAIASSHLGSVRRKLRDLRRIARTLQDMVDTCRNGTLPDCPLIETLSQPTSLKRGPTTKGVAAI